MMVESSLKAGEMYKNMYTSQKTNCEGNLKHIASNNYWRHKNV